MKPLTEFYEGLHSTHKDYSAGTYNFKPLFASRALRQWAQSKAGAAIRFLDVGCGKGLFLREIVAVLQQRWNVGAARITGLDLVRSPADRFAEISEQFEFIQHDVDGHPLPLPDGSFDFIACNHVLEHVFETEKLVREFRRVIAPGGLCIISVPNLAAWMNRVGLLWAGQPIGTEVGTERITYGFRPRFLQARLARYCPAGHIRDFTPRALADLTSACGFETAGWWAQSYGLAARLSKWGGRNISILLQPGERK
jgi:SAM-dependent methyltransferase